MKCTDLYCRHHSWARNEEIKGEHCGALMRDVCGNGIKAEMRPWPEKPCCGAAIDKQMKREESDA
jgi:hypothetical protein